MDAIKIVRRELERSERHLKEALRGVERYKAEEGFDRDRYHYLMGEVAMCRNLLMCLGVFPTDAWES